MESRFVKQGSTFTVTSAENLVVHPKLPPGTYTVGFDPERGFLIHMMEDVISSAKVYGNLEKYCSRILSSFIHRPNNTGALLEGEKGSGKTMLARMISTSAANLGIPTLIINSPFKGDPFNKFMQSINQPTVVIFDEFEKTYDEEDQESVLTLLDGVFTSKKLFILTCNDTYRVDSHLKNRPGRMFYRIEFKGMTKSDIISYCEDNLADKSHIEGVVNITSVIDTLNFDMLKALVEEMNRYNESPKDAISMLNIFPDSGDVKYTCKVSHREGTLSDNHVIASHRKNPLMVSEMQLRLKIKSSMSSGSKSMSNGHRSSIVDELDCSEEAAVYASENESSTVPSRTDDTEWVIFNIPTTNPISVVNGEFVFRINDYLTATFTRNETTSFSFDAL